MHSDEMAYKQELLRVQTERYRALDIRAAQYGINCPVEIKIEMEQLSTSITALNNELNSGHTDGSTINTVTITNRVFSQHRYAQDEMEIHIRDSIIKNEKTSIRIIGVAIYYSWQFLLDILDKTIKNKTLKTMDIEIAILDRSWSYFQMFETWKNRLILTDNEIDLFKQRHSELINQGKINISVFHYNHLPSRHGMLIDDKVLFLSICDFLSDNSGNFELTVGRNQYELFDRNEGLNSVHKISQFNRLFNFYKATSLEQREVPLKE